jgi:hypothetical protein
MPFDGVESPFSYLAQLDRVIDRIETPGRLTKRTYRSPDGRYCLKEALNAAGIADVFEPIILRVAEEVTEKEFCCVESFNDWPETVHGDVVAVLRRVRYGLVSGRFELPAPAPTSAAGGTAGSQVPAFWRKLFRCA